MSQQNLSSVAASVIDSYGNTARNVIGVYRAGGERAIDIVDQRFEAAVNTGAASLGQGLRSNLIDTQQRWSVRCSKGLHLGAERATGAVDAAVDLAHKGARRLAANAERFDQATQLGALEAINRVAMPAAVVVGRFAARIESGSSRLVQRVSRQPAPARAAARQAKAAAKQARAVKRTVARSAGKAASQAAAAKKAVVRKTTTAVRKAKADVTDATAA